MGRFTNKIVVITGGTSVIGLAAARQFIKEGAKVVVIGRSRQPHRPCCRSTPPH
jgi:NAD(P)-dependent dehydrogenase (short-subunit alcohol dehydrogenase family)